MNEYKVTLIAPTNGEQFSMVVYAEDIIKCVKGIAGFYNKQSIVSIEFMQISKSAPLSIIK